MTDYLYRSDDYHDPTITSAFDELSFWASRFGMLLFEHLEIRPGLRVLDLACGNGFPLLELAHTLGRSSHITGVDLWKEGLERAAFKLRVYELPNVGLVRGDGAMLPFGDAHFDLIVSNLGVNNFADPRAVMAECARVTGLGGHLVLTTNVVGHMREFYEVYRAVLTDFGSPLYLERLAVNENHRGTRESICALMEGAGYRVSKIVEDQFVWRFLDGSALLHHSLTRFGFLGGWRRVIEPGDEEAIFTALEDRLNAIARRQGELRLTIPMLYIEGTR